jgi:ribosomal protein S6--L-glutamate ligase
VAKLTVPVAGIPGTWSGEALAAAFRAAGADSFVLPLWQCVHDLDDGTVLWEGRELTNVDALVVKKLGDVTDPAVHDRIQILRRIEEAGVLVASRPEAIDNAVNRYRMSALLRGAGVPMPRTVVTESLDEAETALQRWGSAVLKPLLTSKGRGMMLLSRGAAPRLALRRFRQEGHGMMYLQEFVPAAGRDAAVAVLGGRVIGAYYRVAGSGEWQTTTAAGGHYEPFSPNEAAADLALRAAAVFGLDFTTVDMVETDGGWLIYEVSAFGGFSGLRKALGIDAATLYAQHVLERLRDARG